LGIKSLAETREAVVDLEVVLPVGLCKLISGREEESNPTAPSEVSVMSGVEFLSNRLFSPPLGGVEASLLYRFFAFLSDIFFFFFFYIFELSFSTFILGIIRPKICCPLARVLV